MSKGEGKGWARGRTAATDPRVARNADAHRGKLERKWKIWADYRERNVV